jgi:hypothetical protein
MRNDQSRYWPEERMTAQGDGFAGSSALESADEAQGRHCDDNGQQRRHFCRLKRCALPRIE